MYVAFFFQDMCLPRVCVQCRRRGCCTGDVYNLNYMVWALQQPGSSKFCILKFVSILNRLTDRTIRVDF